MYRRNYRELVLTLTWLGPSAATHDGPGLLRMLAEENRDLVRAVDCLKAELRHQQPENNDLHTRLRMTMRERNAAQGRIQVLAHELAARHQLVLDLQHKLYGSRGEPKCTSNAGGSLVGRRRVRVNGEVSDLAGID